MAPKIQELTRWHTQDWLQEIITQLGKQAQRQKQKQRLQSQLKKSFGSCWSQKRITELRSSSDEEVAASDANASSQQSHIHTEPTHADKRKADLPANGSQKRQKTETSSSSCPRKPIPCKEQLSDTTTDRQSNNTHDNPKEPITRTQYDQDTRRAKGLGRRGAAADNASQQQKHAGEKHTHATD